MEALLREIHKEMINVRRKLHQIPETGFNEVKTSEAVKEKLREYGYEIEEVAKTGVIARRKGNSDKKAIAFRADMDALAVEEKSGVPFPSNHPGRMHACGHDGHMAILLGMALYLSKLETIERDIVFIFQPAEEGPGGARTIVEEGYLEKYNVEAIFGLHIFPGIEEGKVGVTAGPMMAKNAEIDITIHGKSCHGAMPQDGIDGIIAAAHLLQAYQSIISRSIDPIEGAILTIGKITGGEARNILAGSVRLEGTIRTFSTEVFNTIRSRMEEINRGLELSFNCSIELEVREYYPPVINDQHLYSVVKEALSGKTVEIKPMMLAEDFSFYQQAVPGFFMMLGSRNEEMGYVHPLHNCCFNFNEDVLLQGLETFIEIGKAMEAL